MKIYKKKFNELVQEVIDNNKKELYKYRVEDLSFSYVNIKKNRNLDSYDIIVSVVEIETPIILIRDIIEEVCEKMEIKRYRIMIEI